MFTLFQKPIFSSAIWIKYSKTCLIKESAKLRSLRAKNVLTC